MTRNVFYCIYPFYVTIIEKREALRLPQYANNEGSLPRVPFILPPYLRAVSECDLTCAPQPHRFGLSISCLHYPPSTCLSSVMTNSCYRPYMHMYVHSTLNNHWPFLIPSLQPLPHPGWLFHPLTSTTTIITSTITELRFFLSRRTSRQKWPCLPGTYW